MEMHAQMDGYLIDGVKTLYRYGLALLKMFKKEIKSNAYKSGADFWNSMKQFQSGKLRL
jgi:hypothetical protein